MYWYPWLQHVFHFQVPQWNGAEDNRMMGGLQFGYNERNTANVSKIIWTTTIFLIVLDKTYIRKIHDIMSRGTLQADIHIAKFNVTGIHPTHDVLLTRDEAPLGFVVV